LVAGGRGGGGGGGSASCSTRRGAEGTRISSRRAQLAASGVGEKRKRQRAMRDERVNDKEKERKRS